MTREEFNSKASELLANVADTGKVSEILDELRTGFNEEITKGETAAAAVSDLTAKNENLQAANMALFLKTGETAATGENAEENAEENENKLVYADLFDEKGELK